MDDIFAQIFDMVDVGIVILDKDLNVFNWNRWMETHSKIPRKKIKGSSLFVFFPDFNSPWFLRNFKSVLSFGNFSFFSQKLHKYCFPFKVVSIKGSDFKYMQQSCTMGPLRNAEGKIEYVYIMVHDVTEVAAYEQTLIEMNIRDELTGIFNRRHFEVRIKEEFERHRRFSRPFSMIMIDIDFFKKINDDYGHMCGDHALKVVTGTINETIRSIDFFARYGGEEFCCLLPETDLKSATRLAEHLREKIEAQRIIYNDFEFKLTISLGVSELRKGITNSEELINKADIALYEAKRGGRNKVVTMMD